MFVLALRMELHLPHAQTLKDRRQVVRSILDKARQRYSVSASEVGHQDLVQRAALGFAVVASSAQQAEEIIADVDRLVWSYPQVEVGSAERSWLE
ncbi:DUF503 domain-containing protein [Segniliparus rugosus]|uniref:DUF503 domain-containing protein n=1 Tax=Segniliparus rugosus (strain ATCC BAA-974 / DSM 45345 / CCUG 50838 / CIP 108380 / JCM 13579 / CDC 945) TaxID=679197 RepID=E5XTI2_SEGRC|nr:DUF503 domain-containing protein [Segniliparus rugosus]EFV12342.1 hypothetical protein HMPREF9336_02804 [Segniliparus rugosus ATCC BAA-974]